MEQKHSGIGIASFVMSLVFGLGMLVIMVIAAMMEASTPGGMNQESPEAMAVGLAVIGCLLMVAIGGILGVVGVLQKDRNKLFAILGLVLNGLVLLGTVAIIAVGLTMV